MDVSDLAEPEVLELVDPSSDGGTVVFGGYDAPITIAPPPPGDVIDGSRYSF